MDPGEICEDRNLKYIIMILLLIPVVFGGLPNDNSNIPKVILNKEYTPAYLDKEQYWTEPQHFVNLTIENRSIINVNDTIYINSTDLFEILSDKYLMLDTSNDPLVGELAINGSLNLSNPFIAGRTMLIKPFGVTSSNNWDFFFNGGSDPLLRMNAQLSLGNTTRNDGRIYVFDDSTGAYVGSFYQNDGITGFGVYIQSENEGDYSALYIASDGGLRDLLKIQNNGVVHIGESGEIGMVTIYDSLNIKKNLTMEEGEKILSGVNYIILNEADEMNVRAGSDIGVTSDDSRIDLTPDLDYSVNVIGELKVTANSSTGNHTSIETDRLGNSYISTSGSDIYFDDDNKINVGVLNADDILTNNFNMTGRFNWSAVSGYQSVGTGVSFASWDVDLRTTSTGLWNIYRGGVQYLNIVLSGANTVFNAQAGQLTFNSNNGGVTFSALGSGANTSFGGNNIQLYTTSVIPSNVMVSSNILFGTQPFLTGGRKFLKAWSIEQDQYYTGSNQTNLSIKNQYGLTKIKFEQNDTMTINYTTVNLTQNFSQKDELGNWWTCQVNSSGVINCN